MPKIKLNNLITDIRNRMGNNVFSKWKGINYVREYTPPTDRKTEDQLMVRGIFSRLVAVWKNLGAAAQETWSVFAAGRDMSGYNAFIAENFKNMKADLALIISQPMEEEPVAGFSAQSGTASGEISCSFSPLLEQGRELTLFAQKKANGNGTAFYRHEMGGIASPVTISGLEPGAGYHVYAVVTEGPYEGAKKISESVAAEAVAKA